MEKPPTEKADETKSKRGPGRPQSGEARKISRNTILRTALKLATTVPLQDLSIVTVAKTMNVTSALIHYYIGGRDWLTSGVMNLFYKELLRKWPDETGDWKDDLVAAARLIYDHLARYGGVAAYAVSNSRFRVFQLTAFGDRDYGVETLDRFTGRVRASGLSAERTGIYANQLIEFIINTAHGTARHIFPSEHREFLEDKSAKLDPEKYPNIAFAEHGPLRIDGKLAFEEGISLYLLGMTTEAAGRSVADAIKAPPAPATRKKG
jgi:AcrR family transcriptional regulator